jgi:hypothetical protein
MTLIPIALALESSAQVTPVLGKLGQDSYAKVAGGERAVWSTIDALRGHPLLLARHAGACRRTGANSWLKVRAISEVRWCRFASGC